MQDQVPFLQQTSFFSQNDCPRFIIILYSIPISWSSWSWSSHLCLLPVNFSDPENKLGPECVTDCEWALLKGIYCFSTTLSQCAITIHTYLNTVFTAVHMQSWLFFFCTFVCWCKCSFHCCTIIVVAVIRTTMYFIAIFIYLREKKRIRITAISYNQEICSQIATIFFYLVGCMEIFGKSLLLSFFLVLSSPVFPYKLFLSSLLKFM